MPKVPTASDMGLGRVAPGGAGTTPFQHMRAPQNLGLKQLGKGFSDLAAGIEIANQRMQDQRDKRAIMEAENYLRDHNIAQRDKISRINGADIEQGVPDALRDGQQAFGQNKPTHDKISPEAQQRIEGIYLKGEDVLRSWAGEYARAGVKKYDDTLRSSRISNAMQDGAAMAYNEVGRAEAYQKVVATVLEQAKVDGYGGDTPEEKEMRTKALRAALTGFHKAVAGAMNEIKDYRGVQAYVEGALKKGEIDHTEAGQLLKEARANAITVEAQEWADRAMAQFKDNPTAAKQWLIDQLEGEAETQALIEYDRRHGILLDTLNFKKEESAQKAARDVGSARTESEARERLAKMGLPAQVLARAQEIVRGEFASRARDRAIAISNAEKDARKAIHNGQDPREVMDKSAWNLLSEAKQNKFIKQVHDRSMGFAVEDDINTKVWLDSLDPDQWADVDHMVLKDYLTRDTWNAVGKLIERSKTAEGKKVLAARKRAHTRLAAWIKEPASEGGLGLLLKLKGDKKATANQSKGNVIYNRVSEHMEKWINARSGDLDSSTSGKVPTDEEVDAEMARVMLQLRYEGPSAWSFITNVKRADGRRTEDVFPGSASGGFSLVEDAAGNAIIHDIESPSQVYMLSRWQGIKPRDVHKVIQELNSIQSIRGRISREIFASKVDELRQEGKIK